VHATVEAEAGSGWWQREPDVGLHSLVRTRVSKWELDEMRRNGGHVVKGMCQVVAMQAAYADVRRCLDA
jgi:hypothetical protein